MPLPQRDRRPRVTSIPNKRTVALVAVVALGAAGCFRDDDAKLAAQDLRALVLQPADLPPVFERFDEGRQVQADNPGGSRADVARFGREGGWKARYRRPGSPRTPGPLVVESRADLFEDDEGAERDLQAYGADLATLEREAAGIAGMLPRPRLGDEALAATLLQGPGPTSVRFYTIAWRHRNVTASITVNGFEGKLEVGDALELARKQQRRIAAAAK